MDNNYNRPPRNPVIYGMISLFGGCIAVGIAFYLKDWSMIAIILGAICMFLGGFSVGIASHFPDSKDKYNYMWFGLVGIMASVIGFIVGLVNFFGS